MSPWCLWCVETGQLRLLVLGKAGLWAVDWAFLLLELLFRLVCGCACLCRRRHTLTRPKGIPITHIHAQLVGIFQSDSPRPHPREQGHQVPRAWGLGDLNMGQRMCLPPGPFYKLGREIEKRLLLGRKAMTNLDSVFKKQRHHFGHHFANKGAYSQSYGFSSSRVWMWELDH